MALGADYYIKAVILLKGTPSKNNITEAKKTLAHSADIYKSTNKNELAEKSLELLKTLE